MEVIIRRRNYVDFMHSIRTDEDEVNRERGTNGSGPKKIQGETQVWTEILNRITKLYVAGLAGVF